MRRPVRPEDREFLYEVYAATREEEVAQVEWAPGGKEAFLRSQFELQDAAYRDTYQDRDFSVIEVDGQRAGRLYLARWPGELRVVDIALLPEYRGRGIGRGLLEQVMADANAERRKVSLHVEPWNPARRLYERLGFRPVSQIGVYLLLERPL